MRKMRIKKDWLLVCLMLVHYTAIDMASSQECQQGASTVEGVRNQSFVAGRVLVCEGNRWKAICDDEGWNIIAAMVVCRELGFPTEGAHFYFHACLVGSELGVSHLHCHGNETQLSNCVQGRSSKICRDSAAVICIHLSNEACPLHTESTVHYASCDPRNSSSTITAGPQVAQPSSGMMAGDGSTSDTLAIALEILSSILLFTLVGVITGWVWSCHRNKPAISTRREIDNLQPNPCYTTSFAQSSHQTTPQNNSPEEGDYEGV